MQKRFAETVQSRAEALTPSERRLVSSVLSEPRAAALASVTELARGAGVHEATVSRLARKLGFEGYPAFRQALREEFIPSQETAQRMKRTIEASGEEGVLSSLVSREMAALTTLGDHLSDAEIARAASTLMAARRIYIFATGNAEVLALMLAKRFRRYGRDVQMLSGDARALAEGVLGMGAEDALLVYAFRRQPRAYAALLARAQEVGAASLVISGASGRLLVPAPDQLLSAPRGGDAESFQTLTVPMAISNAIVIAAGAVEGTDVLRTLDRLGELIKRFE
ncbi:MAG: MurR/RpiR family transcriptional regulator [Rhodobacteraceae bacterium]|jgi:DNA-binding MurR/RpiR family transcriptional regulator|nr:MurR/RpiR family transcriptional regulator [Paracoccaceae bacterium]